MIILILGKRFWRKWVTYDLRVFIYNHTHFAEEILEKTKLRKKKKMVVSDLSVFIYYHTHFGEEILEKTKFTLRVYFIKKISIYLKLFTIV